MSNRLALVEEAIARFQMDRARALIAEELEENASPEAYYLASQAALSHGQRVQFLRKALEYDPSFQAARDELADLSPQLEADQEERAPVPANTVAPAEPAVPQAPAAPPAPSVSPDSPVSSVSKERRLASVGRRWLAIIIDGLIVAVMTLLLAGAGGAFFAIETALLSDDAAQISAAIAQFQNDVLRVNLLVSALYNVAFMRLFNGQTLGKIILKLRVVKKNGRRISILDAIMRNVFGYTISGMFLLGYFWALLDREKQTWHDKLAGTVVVDERKTLL